MTPRRERQDMIEPTDEADSSEPRLANEPTENADRAEPIEPTDSTDPTDPIESTEPREPMLRIGPSDRIDQRDDNAMPSCWHGCADQLRASEASSSSRRAYDSTIPLSIPAPMWPSLASTVSCTIVVTTMVPPSTGSSCRTSTAKWSGMPS